MEVFSGRSNPTWRVNTRSPVYDRLSRMLSRVRPTRYDPVPRVNSKKAKKCVVTPIYS
ncbi:hypothetical protein DPMN_157737 [Dreissena polymorpha]|uniref:Uncharacterized protein n=1 Tax=Dreissena polymorpha TaxID=45954 RepID=A0A9D4IQA1_DREPO|nr:hypothetical protein DPMN_157737 [Dreissena polymorpha]